MTFRKVTDSFYASPQISVADVEQAAADGFAVIVNNRPDGEDHGQPAGAEIEAAAKAQGLAYVAIPVTSAGFAAGQVEALVATLEAADGPVLGFCRSGTRSTLLWSLARAMQGGDPGEIAAQAAGAGYDISPVRQMVEMLATGAS